MKPLLCSILIPSRKRFDRLLKTIQSFYENADGENFEVIVRFDFDDLTTLSRIPELGQFKNIHALIGHRKNGWDSTDEFQDEMANAAKGDWVWTMNDDAWVEGKGWDTKLSCVPRDLFMAVPQDFQLGGSHYHQVEMTGFPIVPRGCWMKYGWNKLEKPSDQKLYDLLCKKHGWEIHWLEGIKIVHDRDSDEALNRHRRL